MSIPQSFIRLSHCSLLSGIFLMQSIGANAQIAANQAANSKNAADDVDRSQLHVGHSHECPH
ncbi:MAG: hypothetical protein NTX39_04875 [Opitutae bacterium]|nr:hypothetical protein [Opitutae bacterium]